MAAPKPTTALLLSEMQVVGISRSPRGYAAIVEATPINLSYVLYPGERFYDGQLVAIEDNRLIFRRETVFTDGRRERSVEIKSLRQPGSPTDMTTTPSSVAAPAAAESERKSKTPRLRPTSLTNSLLACSNRRQPFPLSQSEPLIKLERRIAQFDNQPPDAAASAARALVAIAK